jgi:hypothetical protein
MSGMYAVYVRTRMNVRTRNPALAKYVLVGLVFIERDIRFALAPDLVSSHLNGARET